MTSWTYKWPNGDVSVIAANSRADVVRILDEVGAADTTEIEPYWDDEYDSGFAIHFKARPDTGFMDFEFDGCSEQLGSFVAENITARP